MSPVDVLTQEVVASPLEVDLRRVLADSYEDVGQLVLADLLRKDVELVLSKGWEKIAEKYGKACDLAGGWKFPFPCLWQAMVAVGQLPRGKCPRCNNLFGIRQRNGVHFDHEIICYNCWYVWEE